MIKGEQNSRTEHQNVAGGEDGREAGATTHSSPIPGKVVLCVTCSVQKPRSLVESTAPGGQPSGLCRSTVRTWTFPSSPCSFVLHLPAPNPQPQPAALCPAGLPPTPGDRGTCGLAGPGAKGDAACLLFWACLQLPAHRGDSLPPTAQRTEPGLCSCVPCQDHTPGRRAGGEQSHCPTVPHTPATGSVCTQPNLTLGSHPPSHQPHPSPTPGPTVPEDSG